MDNAPRVFISYARSDSEAYATDLRQRLETEAPEITLWQDRARMEGGKAWWRQITDALDQVKFMVLVMTPAALRSPVVRKEWQYARQRGVCVYPVVGAPDLDFGSMPRWMRDAHFYHLDKEWATFVNYLKSPCTQARVPFVAPDLPEGYVTRRREIDLLRQAVLDAGGNPRRGTVALHGAGGFGKTTLAAAVCHDDEVITAYDAGVLWVTLGETPNVRDALAKLYAALTGERPGFADAEDAAFHLKQRIGDACYLLVIDDVWDAQHLRPFLSDDNCLRLVTTRDTAVAVAFAGKLETRVPVVEMTTPEAVQLLTYGLDLPPGGHLPFSDLANGALRERMAGGASAPPRSPTSTRRWITRAPWRSTVRTTPPATQP